MEYYNRAAVQNVYQWLLSAIGNDIGVSALMGNLYAESGICPYRCEGLNYTQSMTETLTTIRSFDTAEEFAAHYTTSYWVYPEHGDPYLYYGRGYSLAQWTSTNRKINYWNYVGRENLGNNQKSTEFLIWELRVNYPSVWNALVTATDIREATKKVLFDYESPAEKEKKVDERTALSRAVYDDFSGLPPLPVGGGTLPIWLMKHIVDKRKSLL